MTYLLSSLGLGVEGVAVTYSLACTFHAELDRHMKPFLQGHWEMEFLSAMNSWHGSKPFTLFHG